MTRDAIEAVEFEFEREIRVGDHPHPLGLLHLVDGREPHVMTDGGGDGIDRGGRQAQAREDPGGHVRAERFVSVEMRHAVLERLRAGLADVVEKRAPHEVRGAPCGVAEQEHGVDEDVAFGMVLLRLFHPAHGVDFREDDLQNAESGEQFEAFGGMRTEQDLFEFGADAFGGDEAEFVRCCGCGGRGSGIDREPEFCREPHEAEDAEMVFPESHHGVADGAEDARAEVVEAADAVDDLHRRRIEEQAVDGEVAPRDVQHLVVRV